jgi:hypothetical protein
VEQHSVTHPTHHERIASPTLAGPPLYIYFSSTTSSLKPGHPTRGGRRRRRGTARRRRQRLEEARQHTRHRHDRRRATGTHHDAHSYVLTTAHGSPQAELRRLYVYGGGGACHGSLGEEHSRIRRTQHGARCLDTERRRHGLAVHHHLRVEREWTWVDSHARCKRACRVREVILLLVGMCPRRVTDTHSRSS